MCVGREGKEEIWDYIVNIDEILKRKPIIGIKIEVITKKI